MKHTDTRVQYTKMILRNSLLKLLQDMPIGKVTVKQLCETAGLNRGTFYLHYDSPADLLNDIQHQFLKENQEIFEKYWNNERNVNIMAELFSCIAQNRDICKIIMGSNGNPHFVQNLKNMIREGLLDEWQKEFPAYNRQNLDFLFDFVFSGSMSLILDWIEDDKGIPAAEFTNRLERLGHHCLIAAGEFGLNGNP